MRSPGTWGRWVERLEERALLTGALPNAGAAGMVYDAAGVLHVAYYDSVQHTLKYATRAGDGTWSPIVTVDGSAYAGSQLSLALDSRNAPAAKLYYRHGMRRVGSRLAMLRDLRATADQVPLSPP